MERSMMERSTLALGDDPAGSNAAATALAQRLLLQDEAGLFIRRADPQLFLRARCYCRWVLVLLASGSGGCGGCGR